MASSAWERLAERYALGESPRWRQWFDVDSQRGVLTGPFRAVVDTLELCQPAPLDIWPGFMLPDSLPVVGNDYGDWWCMRVGPQGEITEVIQWSHGGGDWLPIGQSMAEAALWDFTQHWRAPAIAVEQAAYEYPTRPQMPAIQAQDHYRLKVWLLEVLGSPTEIEQLWNMLSAGNYRQALELLVRQAWASTAAICELVEIALQGQLARLADSRLAMHCGINWVPEYTSWLFDTARIPAQAQQLIREAAADAQFDQDWETAEHWTNLLAGQRRDLSWPGDIAGWAALRRGDYTAAAHKFFDNRHASAFTDQSVRLRSHWFAEHYGKFSVAQLAKLKDHLSDAQVNDPYLQLLWHEPISRTRTAIREYWLAQARQAMQGEQYADGYRFYMLAGWDLGAERMSDYLEILDGLVRSATHCGWTARAAVAGVHAECLRRRLNIR